MLENLQCLGAVKGSWGEIGNILLIPCLRWKGVEFCTEMALLKAISRFFYESGPLSCRRLSF